MPANLQGPKHGYANDLKPMKPCSPPKHTVMCMLRIRQAPLSPVCSWEGLTKQLHTTSTCTRGSPRLLTHAVLVL